MVNITHKSTTLRKAIAQGILKVSKQETIDAIINKKVPKGDVFEFSRAAGLLACKKTYEVIPDCHPLPVEYTSISHIIDGLHIFIRVEVHTVYKTGVEVEAMHGAAITALTMYDMLKPIDDGIEISSIKLESKTGGKSDIKYAYPDHLKVAVITCSDSISNGERIDKSGDIINEQLARHKVEVHHKEVISDDFDAIQKKVKQLIHEKFQLILLTGGTGLSSRDVTPDAIRPLIDRDVPGVMEAARNYGQERTPYAMLSRGIAGFAGETLIITLPGSPRGVEESMQAIFPYILHVFRVKEGVRHD
jgi:molybdenum cofactor biosynthesis protein MoaC